MNKIVITGKVAAGKTTMVKSVLAAQSIPWRGFFTERIRFGAETLAHEMITDDGRRSVFADKRWTHLPQLGSMGVNASVFENLGVDVLSRARRGGKLIVMDELGLMEKDAPNFIQEVVSCFNCSHAVMAVIKESAMDFWKSLLPADHLSLFALTVSNRAEQMRRVSEAVGRLVKR